MPTPDDVLSFRSNVGMIPSFFVPRTSDEPPTATIHQVIRGATELAPVPLEVVETGDHPDFGARWQINLTEPFWAPGTYRIAVSSGEVYEIEVAPHTGQIRPDEAKRLAKLPIADQIAVLEAFVPQEA